jgi:LysM repeat protein
LSSFEHPSEEYLASYENYEGVGRSSLRGRLDSCEIAILRHYYTGVELIGFASVAGQPSPPPASAQTYVVAAGDSLLAIAAKFGLDWPTVYLANRALITDPNVLQPGWRLVIPRGPVEEGQPRVHVVQPGDTLFALARAWGCTVAAIVAENGIANESLIRVGQRLQKPIT